MEKQLSQPFVPIVPVISQLKKMKSNVLMKILPLYSHPLLRLTDKCEILSVVGTSGGP